MAKIVVIFLCEKSKLMTKKIFKMKYTTEIIIVTPRYYYFEPPNKGARSASTSDDEDRHTTDIKAMFSDILKEIKELKEQNDNFREETKQNISDLRNEIHNMDKKSRK